MTSKQEASWVIRAQCGDRGALEHLLRLVQPSVARYIRGLVGAAHADDITQEVLIAIYRKLWWLSSPELFRPWMFRIATRSAFRYLKKERRWPEHLRDDEALDELAAPEPAPDAAAIDELLSNERVTPASRAVLILHFKEEMTLLEVAAVLDIPVGTAKSRLAYGLASLRRHHASTGGTNDRSR